MPRNHRVEINKVRKWKVVPHRLGGGNQSVNVKVGDSITFHSSGTAAELHLPFRLFNKNKISVPKGGAGTTEVVKESARGTTLRYAVYCKGEDEFASGNSYPKIITDP